MTYNVLAPRLCIPRFFPTCLPEHAETETRWLKVHRRVQQECASRAIIALQEVDVDWARRLLVLFAEQGYRCVFAQYGGPFTGHMGVLLAWPRDEYETLEVAIARVSGSVPDEAPYGILSRCEPPDPERRQDDEWNLAKQKTNEAIFVRLRPHAPSPSFCVGTYHMPCLFGDLAKVRALNIQTCMLLQRFKDFARDDAAVLMGDFNFKPKTSAYVLAASGGAFDVALEAFPAEVSGLVPWCSALPFFPAGLASAYHSFHGSEPLFTNFTETFVETLDYIWFTPGPLQVVECPPLPSPGEAHGPFPNAAEPSDHLPLQATFVL